jgi:protein Jumonji
MIFVSLKLPVCLLLQLVPSFCKNRKIWLPSDTTMVSPALLVKHGVSVSRAVQHPGQFVIVFPK